MCAGEHVLVTRGPWAGSTGEVTGVGADGSVMIRGAVTGVTAAVAVITVAEWQCERCGCAA
jgi:hypothetical protein